MFVSTIGHHDRRPVVPSMARELVAGGDPKRGRKACILDRVRYVRWYLFARESLIV